MLLIISLSVILLLPVISYLLQPLSNQKSLIFLFTFLCFGGFVLNFLSSNSLTGSWVKATQSDSVLNTITRDGEFDDFLINKYLENTTSEDESFLLGAQVFYKSLELKSFNSAESILKALNLKFLGDNFQVPIFNLLADLRDAKYPNLGNSKVLINIESPHNCKLQSLKFFVSIPNGPELDIATREILSPDINKPFTLDKSNSLVRGFDITSAFLQQEIIKVEAQANCSNTTFQSFKSLDLKYSKDNQEELFFYANEWLKKEQ
jgi:hypothetical protein